MVLRIDHLIHQWLRQVKFPVAKSYLKEKLLSHPDYPSLLSITDVLDDLGIENAALVVDKDRLHEIPVPFIAHTGARGGEFILVRDINKLLKQHPEFIRKDSFGEKNRDGTVVVAEKPKDWKNDENEKYLSEEKRNRAFRWLAISMIILFPAISLANQFSWQNLGLFITALSGLTVAVLIVQHELGISNEITEQLCGAGVNTDCDAVMKSRGSKFLKWFNWADAGIIYFSSVFILLTVSFLAGTTQSFKSILFLFATCSLPFTLFSVYYQWRVVKKWCPLCLAIVSLLWLQFLLFIPGISQISMQNIPALEVLPAAFIIIVNVILWLQFLKPSLQKNKELTDKNFSLVRFKNNPDVFKALLQQQRRVDTTPFKNDLQLGNPDADLQIMVACNPYCGPCTKAHEVLHELVEKNNIGLTIRFGMKTEVAKYIVQLLNHKSKEYKKIALRDWYRWMDLEKFKEKYPIQYENAIDADDELTGLTHENGFFFGKDVEKSVEQLENWSKDSKIAYTPTIFINGNELPKQYKTKDLNYIIRNIETAGDTERKMEPVVAENKYIPV